MKPERDPEWEMMCGRDAEKLLRPQGTPWPHECAWPGGDEAEAEAKRQMDLAERQMAHGMDITSMEIYDAVDELRKRDAERHVRLLRAQLTPSPWPPLLAIAAVVATLLGLYAILMWL